MWCIDTFFVINRSNQKLDDPVLLINKMNTIKKEIIVLKERYETILTSRTKLLLHTSLNVYGGKNASRFTAQRSYCYVHFLIADQMKINKTVG